MKQIKKYIAFSIALVAILACREEGVRPNVGDGVKPQPVGDVVVTGGHGVATLKFHLKDQNTLYVLAQYESREGVTRSAKSSKYKDELILDGFASGGTYPVTIYAVGKGEQKSDPVMIEVDVLPPPVVEAFNTLVLRADFGGLNISFLNEYEGDLAVDVLTNDEFGNRKLIATEYTSQSKVSFSIRGFEAEPHQFFVVMRDRWENKTDTVGKQLTPLFEEQLDRTKMQGMQLLPDTYERRAWRGNSPRQISFMFDGNTTNDLSIFHTKPDAGVPCHFTIDMGASAKLSRFKFWMRNTDLHTFDGPAIHLFEIYGSNEPDEDGSWENWILLGDYEAIKPSGLPRGELSPEDRAAHAAGLEFSIPIEAPAVRYIRVRVKETWGLFQYISIAELAFWGEIVN